MRSAGRGLVLAVLASGAMLIATPARAESEADTLFRQGRELLEKSRWREACDKLQRSEKLAPAAGTLLNLGYCWEQLGRMRSAMDAYAEAEILASDANDAKSATFARQRFNEVEGKVTKLVIRPEREAPSMQITKNGQPVPKTDWGKPIAVDPDDFIVAATAPGHVSWHGSAVTAKGEGTLVTIVVPPLARDAAVDTLGSLGTRRFAALGVGAGAFVAFGAGTALALSAKSHHDDANALCDASGCDETGSRIKASAVEQGNIATVLFVAGLACVGTAVYLWLTATPSRTARHERFLTGVTF